MVLPISNLTNWYTLLMPTIGVIANKPLINNDEKAEAWEHGPVYRSIYNMFGRFRAENIPSYMHRGVSLRPVSFDEDKSEFLQTVWDTYKDKESLGTRENVARKGKPLVYCMASIWRQG